MTQRFDDMARERDALYQATSPEGEFEFAIWYDRMAYATEVVRLRESHRDNRDAALLPLAIRALTARQQKYPVDVTSKL